jgi:protoporphyrinogen oxidase
MKQVGMYVCIQNNPGTDREEEKEENLIEKTQKQRRTIFTIICQKNQAKIQINTPAAPDFHQQHPGAVALQ